MTDLDAVCYLKELQQYNLTDMLHTPQNSSHDTIWDCAFDHAIRALLERAGLSEENITFEKRVNGSFVAHVSTPRAEKPTLGHVEYVYILYTFMGRPFEFRAIVTPAKHDSPSDIQSCIKQAIKGVRPENLADAVTAACSERGWDCRFLSHNATGFPSTIEISGAS